MISANIALPILVHFAQQHTAQNNIPIFVHFFLAKAIDKFPAL
jgi:hypothetical protein